MSERADASRRAVEAVWRIESARLVGGLVRVVRDVELAAELAQDALVRALEVWPETGIPDNPGAWLMTSAKNAGLDALRHRAMRERKLGELGAEPPLLAPAASPGEAELVAALDEEVDDDVLRLVLVACHPILSREARVALTLRLVAGLGTDEIARAYVAPEPTIAQRIVRAKRTIAEARVPFEVPRGEELRARVASALEVIYLIFNEGYTATRGDEWMRVELCHDALRLGRTLAALVPGDPEVHGLVALMELQASREDARVSADGAPILLLEQDRARWDPRLVRSGLASLARAEALGGPLGVYALQAAIAACHARAGRAEDTDWARMVALYDALAELTGSPIVELNRAVAVAMAEGPEAGLALVDALASEPALRGYHLLPAVRGDLLAKLGRTREARAEVRRAAELATNACERALLLARADALRDPD